jgi:hypothetical protein
MSDLHNSNELNRNSADRHMLARGDLHVRQTRAIQQPGQLGFFEKIAYIGGLIFRQYNETRSAFSQVREILQDSFSDTATTTKRPIGMTTTVAPDGSTTTEKYRISRAELGRILNRNFRGLQKLFRIEVADARNQTRYTIAEYKNQYLEQVKPPNTRVKINLV